MLTVRNLERLRQLDAKNARRMVWLVLALFVAGRAILFSVAPLDNQGRPQPDPNILLLQSFAVAVATLVVQRNAYRSWRLNRSKERSGPWLPALGLALLYEFGVWLAAFPIWAIGHALASAAIVTSPW